MILDRLSHASTYDGLPPLLRRALHSLASTDWETLQPGRHDIDGSRLFALVSDYQTRVESEVPWEAHRQFIDVQYVQSGIERIGHAHLSTLAVGAYDDARDMLRATGSGGFLLLPAGTFAILWPHDAHRPGIAADLPAPVRKVVLKVAVEKDRGRTACR